jgi:hypothetical protein
MRGHIQFPFLAEVHRLDALAMAADPDGAGPLTSGLDPDFHEPVLVSASGAAVGEPLRRELAPVRVRCQVEPDVYDQLAMTPGGNAPRTRLGLVFHFRDLERQGLVDAATGDALLGPGDRLGALYDVLGNLVQLVRTPPGLYITEARAAGFGLNRRRPRRNLLIVTCEDRPQAPRRSS